MPDGQSVARRTLADPANVGGNRADRASRTSTTSPVDGWILKNGLIGKLLI
jgi:hypothetical protein